VPDRTYVDYSADRCAKSCANEASFDCESFEYCWISGKCRLTRSLTSTNDSVEPTKDLCDIYQRKENFDLFHTVQMKPPFRRHLIFPSIIGDALYHYQKNPIQAAVSKSYEKFKNVKNPSDCARLCDTSAKYQCRGFSYCETTQTCYLSKTHLSDNGNTPKDSDTVCPHYRSNMNFWYDWPTWWFNIVDWLTFDRIIFERFYFQIDSKCFDYKSRYNIWWVVNRILQSKMYQCGLV
jgi:hypothetical protein